MSDRKLLTVLPVAVGLWVVLMIGLVVVLAPRARRGPRTAAPSAAPTAPILATASVDPAKQLYPGKPLPCGPKAYTDRQFGQVCLSYYRKRGVLAYRQFGKHKAAWDSLAVDFLERNAYRQAGVKPVPDLAHMLDLARRLVDSRCDDPVVLAQVGLALNEAEDWQGAEACLQQAVAGFRRGAYPPYCKVGGTMGLARRKWRLMAGEQAANRLLRADIIAALVPAAQARVFAPGEQRVFWGNVLVPALKREFKEHEASLVGALQARAETDPWLLRMALGQQSLEEGWRARGQGWAQQVRPEAWPVFERGLQGARRNWEQAYKLHPEYPEAAGNLITVTYASSSGNPRVWFDRAVAAQFDYMTAYLLMTEALLPRWGGTHGAMLAFGKECLDTGRFDTQVPMVYQQVVQTIAERDSLQSIWQSPQVWQNVEAAYGGRLSYLAAQRPEIVRAQGTTYALLAWRTGHLDTARRQLDAMGGEMDRSAFGGQMAQGPEIAVASIYASSDEQRKALTEAERLFQEQKVKGALPALSRLLRREKEPHVRRYLQSRLQTLRWEQDLGRGGWVDLLVTDDLAGWEMLRGTCKPLPDGKGFLLYPDDLSAVLSCQIRPGLECETTCDVEFPAEAVRGIGAGVLGEVTTAPEGGFDACTLRREPPHGACGVAGGAQRVWPLREVPQQLAMRLLKDGDQYTLKMNEVTVFQNQRIGKNGTTRSATVGFGGVGWPERSKPVIYRNIRIRRGTGR